MAALPERLSVPVPSRPTYRLPPVVAVPPLIVIVPVLLPLIPISNVLLTDKLPPVWSMIPMPPLSCPMLMSPLVILTAPFSFTIRLPLRLEPFHTPMKMPFVKFATAFPPTVRVPSESFWHAMYRIWFGRFNTLSPDIVYDPFDPAASRASDIQLFSVTVPPVWMNSPVPRRPTWNSLPEGVVSVPPVIM